MSSICFTSRAALGALPAGGATPDLFLLYLSQTEGSLADQLAHTELSHPVPGTDGIALAALIAEFDGVSAFLSYLIDDLFKGSYGFHDSLYPLSY